MHSWSVQLSCSAHGVMHAALQGLLRRRDIEASFVNGVVMLGLCAVAALGAAAVRQCFTTEDEHGGASARCTGRLRVADE